MTANHESFHQENIVTARCLCCGRGLGMVHGHGFFAQNVFPCLRSFDDPLRMKRVRRGDVNRFHARIRQQFLIAAVRGGNIELGGKCPGLCGIATADCGKRSQAGVLDAFSKCLGNRAGG